MGDKRRPGGVGEDGRLGPAEGGGETGGKTFGQIGDVAVAAAARRAGLAEWQVVWPEPPTSLRQRMARSLGALAGTSQPLPTSGGALAGIISTVERDLQGLLQWNDPRDVYTHCLCEAP